MIDIEHEELIPLRDVPKLLPRRPNGKRLHISAVYRWKERGVNGMKLETVKVGGTTYTSLEALKRFAVQCEMNSHRWLSFAPRTNQLRERQISRATKAVDDLLGLSSPRR